MDIFIQQLVCFSLVFVASISAQSCQNYGQECFNHPDCCGGCCDNSICIDSTRVCSAPIEDCETFYCPAGQICTLYQTPDCSGCAIVPTCSLDPEQEHHVEDVSWPSWLTNADN